jgi:hypothetical protein
LTERPLTNVDEFRHRPVNELAALLPDQQAVDAAIKDLQTANIDISTVRVLHGEKGSDVLDPTGAEHGLHHADNPLAADSGRRPKDP